MVVIFTGDQILNKNAQNKHDKIGAEYKPRIPAQTSMRRRVQVKEKRKGAVATNVGGANIDARRRCCVNFRRRIKLRAIFTSREYTAHDRGDRGRARRARLVADQIGARLEQRPLPFVDIKRISVHLIQLVNVIDEQIVLDEIVERDEQEAGANGARVEYSERFLKLERNTRHDGSTREQKQNAQPGRIVGVKQVDYDQRTRHYRHGTGDAQQKQADILDEQRDKREQTSDRQRYDEVFDQRELLLFGQYEVDNARAERETDEKRRQLQEPIADERVEHTDYKRHDRVAQLLHRLLLVLADHVRLRIRAGRRGRRRRGSRHRRV